MSDAAVVVEARGHTLWIALNRPEALNAHNEEMRTLLVDAIDRLEDDDELLVGVVHGVGGRAFSAGADLKEHEPGKPGRLRPEGRRPVWRHFEAFRWVSKPLVAAIDGWCLGGGLELASYCDIRLATTQSRFGQPEPRTVGGTAGPGLIQLSRLVPMGEALLMQLSSQPISAQRAYEIGLVQRLFPDESALLAEAEALADQIAECNPAALRTVKRVVKWGDGLTYEQAELMARLWTEAEERGRADDGGWQPPSR